MQQMLELVSDLLFGCALLLLHACGRHMQEAVAMCSAMIQPKSVLFNTRQAEETQLPSSKPSRTPREPKSGLSSSTQGLLQSRPGRQAAPAGTGMLFALQSMANRMSPVLSSYVTHQHAQDQPSNETTNDDRHGIL